MIDYLCTTIKTLALSTNSIFQSTLGQRWEAKDIPDLSGRVAIVTGGNTGLGYVSCLELARHGAKVYMASRTESRAKAAIEKIKKELPDAQIEFIHFDLTILSTARSAVNIFTTKEQRLDILINNAGVMNTPFKLSPDGIELQACNATGHFALTHYLLPILKRTDSTIPDADVRIVNLSSIGHLSAYKPDFSSVERMNGKPFTSFARYANSKLANILLTNELQKRLVDTNICCLSVHPGMVATELFDETAQAIPLLAPLLSIKHLILSSPYDGALNQLYAATSIEIRSKNLKGAYIVPYAQVGIKKSIAREGNGNLGEQFWQLCEKVLQQDERREQS